MANILLEPVYCKCGTVAELAWITYADGLPEKIAWRCPSCRFIVKKRIQED